MGQLTLSTKEYLGVMRAVELARTLDEHLSDATGEPIDADWVELYDKLLDSAEEFGMSFPSEDPEERHWTDDMHEEADDALHEMMEMEVVH